MRRRWLSWQVTSAGASPLAHAMPTSAYTGSSIDLWLGWVGGWVGGAVWGGGVASGAGASFGQ